ncbi:MAG TPA: hypothetical protein VIO64_09760 [Pseudobacteroides sp.]|uniref:J domain-containing protein n=1 Tax=Pseudobacteroides sp. TaxID=1968840 RepID=UPI002F947B07
MNIWNILSIEPTDDISTIKKAYATKLKTCHPEDNPESYQKLREAFDSAIKYAKMNRKSKESVTDAIQTINNCNKDSNIDRSNDAPLLTHKNGFDTEYTCDQDMQNSIDDHISSPKSKFRNDFTTNVIALEYANDGFIEDAANIYNNFSSRIDEKKWEALLDCDLMWNLKNQEQLSIKMISFLSSHHCLPNKIWRLLDAHFDWSKSLEGLDRFFPKTFIKYIKRRVNEKQYLHYSHFVGVSNIDLEKYLELRESAFDDMNNRDFNNAYISLRQAEEIYSDDPELWKLQGMHHFYVGNLDAAEELFKRCLKFKSDDIIIFYSSRILFRKERYSEALDECQKLQDLEALNVDQLEFVAKCYTKANRLEEAKKLLLKALQLDPKCDLIRTAIFEINKKIRDGILWEIKKNRRDKELRSKLEQINNETKLFISNVANKNGYSSSKRRFIESGKFKILLVAAVVFAIIFIQFTTYLKNIDKNSYKDSFSFLYESNTPMPTSKPEDIYMDITNPDLLSTYGNESRIDYKNSISPGLAVRIIYEEDGISKLTFRSFDNDYSKYQTDDLIVLVSEYNGKKIILLTELENYMSRFMPRRYKFSGIVFEGRLEITDEVFDSMMKYNIFGNEIIPDKFIKVTTEYNDSYVPEDIRSTTSPGNTSSEPNWFTMLKIAGFIIIIIVAIKRYSRY